VGVLASLPILSRICVGFQDPPQRSNSHECMRLEYI
jgi:hypothetical protein